MRGDVVMLNTYLDDDAARRAGLQDHCQVFGVSPLLRHLLEAALAIPPVSPSMRDRCVLTLLIDEIGAM
ncbi:AraC family transcriptional regulator, partial [Klebsiella variicola]